MTQQIAQMKENLAKKQEIQHEDPHQHNKLTKEGIKSSGEV